MKIVVILQARASSSRLPQKVLRPILDAPMLQRQIERVQRSKLIDQLIVATSVERSDDAIEALCGQLDVHCFRGSLDDVLDRFYQAAKTCQPDHVVRLTGDCPLIDPEVIDKVLKLHLDEGVDYTSNGAPPTYPDGLDVEVMTFRALQQAWTEASLKSEREHVTPYMRKPNSGLSHCNVTNDVDLSHLRWTVDEPEDLEFVVRIYENLYEKNPCFGSSEVMSFLEEQPEMMQINQGFVRNEGYQRSLANDKN